MKGIVANRWILVPIALLSMTVVITTATVLSAVVGHPLGAEPAYDVKAAAWDAERGQRQVNERLRWVVTPELASDGSARTIALRIEDKHGVRIDAERVLVECIPVRAAELRKLVELDRSAVGEFTGRFDSPIGGQWEFRIEVLDDGIRYTDACRRFLTEATRG